MTPKETKELLLFVAVMVALTVVGFLVMGAWVNLISIPSALIGGTLLARRHNQPRESR